MNDLLPKILLSTSVVQQWNDVVRQVVSKLVQERPAKLLVDEEQAELRDGQMVVFSKVNGQRVELVLKPEDWCWRDRSLSAN